MKEIAGRSSTDDLVTHGYVEVGLPKARRPAALFIVLCLLASLLTVVVPQAVAEECVPGENGCLPTRAQCATGEYNGYWDGGSPSRFAVCLAYEGKIVAYAGGTASVPPCGDVVVADQVIAGGGGDPNPCGRPSDTPLSDDPLADAAMRAGLDWCSNDVDPDSPSAPVSFPSAPEVEYTTCVGEIASFDGVEIDARLTWPQGAAGPLPVVTLLHGWSGERRAYQNPNDDPSGWGWARFLSRGYATLAITARGFWASCGMTDQVSDVDELEIATGAVYEATGGVVNVVAVGSGGTKVTEEEDPAQCIDGYTHIAERSHEVRDTQHLLGVLVDAGIADAERLAVTGASYGGGQSWLLATGESWETPADRTIQIAASVPIVSWTDLSDALLPNGRVSDEVPGPARGPVGVLKASTFNELFRTGRAKVPVAEGWGTSYIGPEQGRYNTFKPQELHSFIDGWAAVWNAGEPYGSAADDIRDALQGKSAMYAHDYLAAVAAREIEPTPVFALQGWTDPLFPAVQAIQMYQRMKTIHPGYPVSLALGNFGHVTDPSQDQLAVAYDLAGRFIDAHLLAGGEGAPEATVYSFDVTCGAGSTDPVSGRWEELTRARLTLSDSTGASMSSVARDPAAGLATDPVAVGAAGGSTSCLRHDSAAKGAASWSWRVQEPEEMLGLPEVMVDYLLAGEDATLIAKLWDVSDQGRILVTRGVYRISTAHGDPQAGELAFKLFGSHWTFAAGHTIELELSQTDAPYLRPNSLPSSIEIREVDLVIPRPGGWGPGGRTGHGPASP